MPTSRAGVRLLAVSPRLPPSYRYSSSLCSRSSYIPHTISVFPYLASPVSTHPQSADVDAALAAADGKRPSKRQRSEGEGGEEGGKKKKVMPLTRAQQIIAEAHKARPVPLAPAPRKPTAAAAAGAGAKGGKQSGALVVASGSKGVRKGGSGDGGE